MILLSNNELEELTTELNKATLTTVEDSINHIRTVMKNGEHKLITLVQVIEDEVEMILEYVPSRHFSNSRINPNKIEQALRTALTNHTMSIARSMQ